MTDEITKSLKKKYKTLMEELKAEFTTNNILVLLSYDTHLHDETILKDYKPSLSVNHDGELSETLLPQESLLISEKQRSNLQNYNSLGYFEAHKNASFDLFERTSKSREDLYKAGLKFINDLKNKKPVTGLYIYGKNRIGKTYFASCLANELTKSFATCFLYFPDFSRSISDSVSDQTLEEKIRLLKNADVLILDDFGQGRKSAWLRDAVLLPIIQHRISHNLPLIFTSNYSLLELINILEMNDSNETRTNHSEQVAVSLVSRIKEAVKTYELKDK